LYDGRLLAPGNFECKTEKIGFLQRGLFTTEEKHTILFKELPVILHSRWEAPDGRQALVMINFTAHPQKCIADGTEYQMPARSCKIIITP